MRPAGIATLLLLFPFFVIPPAQVSAQQKPQTNPTNVDWDALTPRIKTLLPEGLGCTGDDTEMWVGDNSDVTGDGTPLALVECGMGAYMDSMTFITLKQGEPVLAKFRDGHGRPTDQDFIDGASVMHGAATIRLPAEHAIVQLYWNAKDDEEPTVADCGGTAYIWNRRSKTFDINPKQHQAWWNESATTSSNTNEQEALRFMDVGRMGNNTPAPEAEAPQRF